MDPDDVTIDRLRDIGLTEAAEAVDNNDVLAVRLRAKAALLGAKPAATSAVTDDDSIKIDPETFQINRDTEEAVAEMEDPDLIAHIAEQRDKLLRETALASRGLTADEMKVADRRVRETFSESMLDLKELRLNVDLWRETLAAHARHTTLLATGGRPPHGYPSTPEAQWQHISKKMDAAVSGMDGLIKAVEKLEKDLTVQRRDYEQIVERFRAVLT